MQVWMMPQGLSPGMKQAKEADPGAQALRVGGDLEQGLGSRSKQQVIDDSFVLQRQCRELLRQGKHHMEILDGQQFISARLHPLGSGCSLALGAMAITAGVICDLLIAALIALFEMTAQGSGPTSHNVLDHTAL